MSSPRVLLVHGYSGSPDSLKPLAAALEEHCGEGSTTLLRLPGHGPGCAPSFDRTTFVQAIVAAINETRGRGGHLVLVGHSTGGALALAALADNGIAPDLVVLASVPKRIDAAYLDRWKRHRTGMPEIPFASVANMISLINASGSLKLGRAFPVIILQGTEDELVPPGTLYDWKGSFAGPVKEIMVPDGVHDLFRGPKGRFAVEALVRAVRDGLRSPTEEEKQIVETIGSVEPEVLAFIGRSPSSACHLAASPSGLAAAGREPVLPIKVSREPIIANVEITTRCNLKCPYCARTMRGVASDDMSLDRFRTILRLLPNAYRITLVGLGETLMHPRVVDFVAAASTAGRRVALVTNAMLLDETLSKELLKAGLESIAFSIDGATQELASELRPGTDLERVTQNIRKFVALSRPLRPVSTAVFSAVSKRTVSSLGALVKLTADLGVHVMMMSDLNFAENQDQTLWRNSTSETAGQIRAAIATAFRNKLPVLSVHGLEEFGLWKRYEKFLLLPPERLFMRSERRSWCCSPWQTVPVNVRGEVTICDCQPELIAGNLLEQPLPDIWNGDIFLRHRERMLGTDLPDACRICPRL